MRGAALRALRGEEDEEEEEEEETVVIQAWGRAHRGGAGEGVWRKEGQRGAVTD